MECLSKRRNLGVVVGIARGVSSELQYCLRGSASRGEVDSHPTSGHAKSGATPDSKTTLRSRLLCGHVCASRNCNVMASFCARPDFIKLLMHVYLGPLVLTNKPTAPHPPRAPHRTSALKPSVWIPWCFSMSPTGTIRIITKCIRHEPHGAIGE